MYSPMFQYISCYSLSQYLSLLETKLLVSIHLMLLFIPDHIAWDEWEKCFNTSHVTLYPGVFTLLCTKTKFQYISCYSLSIRDGGIKMSKNKFQYISCYSLSTKDWYKHRENFMFQYISCYSLSPCTRPPFPLSHSFNTSHVTLYPLPFQLSKVTRRCFNTSHVTLYPMQSRRNSARNGVSIHLMLLFIFQYRHCIYLFF